MPTIYKRKCNTNRASWTEAELHAAIHSINKKELSVKGAAKQYNIPFTTLRRRLKAKDIKKPLLGSPSCLGETNEYKIVTHIKKLQAHGFAPTKKEVCRMAYGLAEKYCIKHRFSKEKKMAGAAWFTLFMQRHQDLSLRKAEGVSQARAEGMSRDEVSKYFALLGKTLTDNSLIDKPGHIYNMDETGCQLNNRAELVIAERGSRNVPAITSAEKGETITVVACCNAEGNFLPPACVFKGKNKKPEFEDGMPPGSVVYMGGKSAYVNSEIFYAWLKHHFVPRKPQGKVVIILDGHSSHCSNIEMLEYAVENEIILLCLPPHTTQFLQPLDRAYFKSFKTYFYEACNMFIKTNPKRKINRIQFGKLLSEAWAKSATSSNGISAFSSTGIFPFNPSIIPDYAYIQINDELARIPTASSQLTPQKQSSTQVECIRAASPEIIPLKQDSVQVEINQGSPEIEVSNITPGKLLDVISPVPSTSQTKKNNPRKQSSRLLTSLENIVAQKCKLMKREKADSKPKSNKKKNPPKKKSRKNYQKDETSSEEENISLQDESDNPEDFDENMCTGCGEEYLSTTKKDDWIKCIVCLRWSHDSCISFINTCTVCGNNNIKKNKFM